MDEMHVVLNKVTHFGMEIFIAKKDFLKKKIGKAEFQMPNNHSEEETNEYQAFDPYFTKKAKMEVNVNEFGVFLVGNAEGFLSFARIFTYLAEVHMLIREEPLRPETNTVDGYGAYHLTDFVSEERILKGDYLFNPGPLHSLERDPELFFWPSDVIGPDFWKGKTAKSEDEK